MAEYNPSKIIKDGNTYNFRDDTKIPLAGSNAISGSLIPATDNAIDIGSSTNNIKTLYTKGITIDGKTINTDANDNLIYDSHIVDTIEEQGEGYIRYSNGLQICWTTVDLITSSSYATWTYPKTFISTPCVLWQAWGRSTATFDVAGGGTRTTSSADFVPFRNGASSYGAYGVSGLAIGRWK